MASDIEQHSVSSANKVGQFAGESETGGVKEPLLAKGNHEFENFSVVSAILPFLFPAFGGLLYGYDIGATSSATISIQV
ncbi:D-xylose-proton symporter-like 2 [Olea europaea subsp. europaea]|uniref:D-xylose-proton symporter-like 2 n=1 Tax=Olea europaea subsp. europaea TaxID=158383 RepID=A0A8S0UU14_OLEEU|nr:D-xylose-proton symporter-like 2 [Olea europaea subsp. europaea]